MSVYANALPLFPKSRYRPKYSYDLLFLIVVYSSVYLVFSYNSKCKDLQCVNGECINGTCICRDGWQGSLCQFCGGKIKVSNQSGYIYDGVGNYSVDIKCSWLIDVGGSNNTTIRLHIEEFSTECGWDYLYIFDGDSVSSPLVAVLSGQMYTSSYSVRRLPEIVTTSGYALIYFYSDIAVNMSGFNISYRLNSCPTRNSSEDCSGNGVCIDGTCTCSATFTGEACDIPICPNDCSNNNGFCRHEQHKCECNAKYKGDDCSQIADNGYWEAIQTKDFLPEGLASHTAVVWRDSMYVIGGESYKKAEMIYVYDFNGNVWETPHIMDSRNVPVPRYGHSSVLFGDKIYMYGGMLPHAEICSELWAFDVSAKIWENITVRSDPCIHANVTTMCGPLKSVGHTATLFTNKSRKTEIMIVIFGYSPMFGLLNTVQEYHFGTREWKIVKTKGYPVKGGYGHSSAWDPLTQRIYVYGGFISTNAVTAHISDRLYSYDPSNRLWKMLMIAPSSRFLHTANFIDGLMLVFGGNTYNGSLRGDSAKCYSNDFLMYDAFCDCWTVSSVPQMFYSDLARFGHSAVVFEGKLYIYGGFNGQLMNDILRFTPGLCHSLTSQSACLNVKLGVKCIWDRVTSKCLPNTAIPRSQITSALDRTDDLNTYIICAEETRSQIVTAMSLCASLIDCQTCVHTSLDCAWCPHQGICSQHGRCKEPILNSNGYNGLKCISEDYVNCHNQHTCAACSLTPGCHWYRANSICVPLANVSLEDQQEVQTGPCPMSCKDYSNCANCTDSNCMWCHNEERCIDKNVYLPLFPYGQCREWTAMANRCRIASEGKSPCHFYVSCEDCRADPECGWCADGTGTGVGHCFPGGNTHPPECLPDNWYFTYCPSCQCNGHSVCENNTNSCVQPCKNNTHGHHCERCTHGFYGSALNGGQCSPCDCHKQATQCHMETGKCFCTTKGIAGDHCEKCDLQNHYFGDPTAPHGSCFYELTIDYQFTFNMSKKEDRHYRQINFKNSPTKSDIDADFNIMCSVPAKMNITKKIGDRDKEKVLLEAHNCSNFRTKFSKNEHTFGIDNNDSMTTFYVYVYDFHPPLWIQISFSQYPKLNLQQFFITFSSCFLLLLLVAAVLWKLKQKWDTYRRRQRLFVEMVQMARRPFSSIQVEMNPINITEDDVATIAVSDTLSRRKKEHPNPIAMEPCGNGRAAVLSLIVRLPTGSEAYAPSGQTGIAIASALVTIGTNSRKISIDSTVKTDTKGKIRKCAVTNQNNIDNCI